MSSRAMCVYCHRREVEGRYRPFCSARCQMADLGRWLNGDYRVAAEPGDAPPPDGADLDEAPDGQDE